MIGLERLRHKTIRTGVECCLVSMAPRAHDDDGSFGTRQAFPELAEDLEATLSGQHQIEDDQVRPQPERELERLFAVMGFDESVFVAEDGADERSQSLIVLADEDRLDTAFMQNAAFSGA